jgi:impB/mucB/samB family.
MFATLYLPNFYLQAAARHQPELRSQPLALLDDRETKPVIIQLNDAAEKAGVRKGMTPTQGLARCLSLTVKIRGRTQEQLLDEIVLHYAFTLAPMSKRRVPVFAQFNLRTIAISSERSRE